MKILLGNTGTSAVNMYLCTYYKLIILKKSLCAFLHITIESGIDVGQGISVGPGNFGKKNKRRALNTHVLCSK